MDAKKQKIKNDKPAAPKSGVCFNYEGSYFTQNYPNKDEFVKTNNSHKIHAITNQSALDNQTTPIILEGMLLHKIVSIMLYNNASDSFISSYLLHSLPIKAKLLKESWKVEFALGQKCKVTKFLENATLNLSNFQSKIHLYVVPLPTYDIILGVDGLQQNKALINFE